MSIECLNWPHPALCYLLLICSPIFALTLGLLFLLQLYAERYKIKAIGRIPYLIHRIGIFLGFGNIFYNLSIYSYPINIIGFLGCNLLNTALLWVLGMSCCFVMQALSDISRTPFNMNIRKMYYIHGIFLFIFTITAWVGVNIRHKSIAQIPSDGYYIITSCLSVGNLFFYQYHIVKHIEGVELMDQNKQIRMKQIQRLQLQVFYIFGITVLAIGFYSNRIHSAVQDMLISDNDETIMVLGFFIVTAATFFVLWYGWIPLSTGAGGSNPPSTARLSRGETNPASPSRKSAYREMPIPATEIVIRDSQSVYKETPTTTVSETIIRDSNDISGESVSPVDLTSSGKEIINEA